MTKSEVSTNTKAALRALPQVGRLAVHDDLAAERELFGAARVNDAVKAAIDDARSSVLGGSNAPTQQALVDATRRVLRSGNAGVRRVLNGTGVLIHTNLGRAPLSAEAVAAMVASAQYAAVEFDLATGKRGDRHRHGQADLIALTGAEDACVVNNCAAAVMLMLAAVVRGGEVVMSRGELVEIGGGFRVPDVMRQSGATLCEVGTTNRTHRRDFEQALGDRSAAFMKVHRSNFSIEGFTAEVSTADLADIAHAAGLPLLVDAGAGLVERVDALAGEATIRSYLEAGADLVCFSGDKLLGGPQCGLIVGTCELVERCRRHPLMRALRCDKMTLAALGATLSAWRYNRQSLPVVAMLEEDTAVLRARAEAVAARLDSPRVSVVESEIRIGGGSAPSATRASVALSISGHADVVLARLRANDPPLIGRAHDGSTRIDFRTLFAADDDAVIAALHAVLAGNA